MTPYKNLTIAALGFGLSVILTGLFIHAYEGYISLPQMLLSGVIAGGKWALQLTLAWVRLAERKWVYYREMGIICAIGSAVLLPYIALRGSGEFFLWSLAVCVIVMGILIFWRLPKIGLGWLWSVLWVALLAIAVSLQLTVVFRVIG